MISRGRIAADMCAAMMRVSTAQVGAGVVGIYVDNLLVAEVIDVPLVEIIYMAVVLKVASEGSNG